MNFKEQISVKLLIISSVKKSAILIWLQCVLFHIRTLAHSIRLLTILNKTHKHCPSANEAVVSYVKRTELIRISCYNHTKTNYTNCSRSAHTWWQTLYCRLNNGIRWQDDDRMACNRKYPANYLELSGQAHHSVIAKNVAIYEIDGLVQEIRNSGALAMELRMSCNKLSRW